MIPDNWIITTIDEICEPINKTNSKKENHKESLDYFDIDSIDNQRSKITSPKKLLWSNAPSRAQQIVKKNDILFSTVRTYLKNIAIIEHHDSSPIASTGFCVLRPMMNISNKYLFWYTLTSPFLNTLSKIQRGTSYPAVRNSDVLEQQIPLPPLPEQHRIVNKIEELFTRLDDGVATLKKLQKQLKRYRQSTLSSAILGDLTSNWREKNKTINNSREMLSLIAEEKEKAYQEQCKQAINTGISKPKDPRKTKKSDYIEDSLPDLPYTWNYSRLEDICYRVTDGTHFTPKYKDDGIPFFSVKNVRPFTMKFDYKKYISQEEHDLISKRCPCEKGDILYTKVGATYGYASIDSYEKPHSIFVSLCLMKPVHKYIMNKYLEIAFNSHFVFTQAHKRVSGIGVPDLHLIEIRDFKIPIPPIEEQQEVITLIEQHLSVIDNMEETIENALIQANSLRQSILKKAFTGKLVPQDPTDEPAEKLLKRIKAKKAKLEAETKNLRKTTRKKGKDKCLQTQPR